MKEYLSLLQESLEHVCKETENGCVAMEELLKDIKDHFEMLRKGMESDFLQFKSMKCSSCFRSIGNHLKDLTENGLANLYFIPLEQSLCFIENTKDSLSKMNKTRSSIKASCSELVSIWRQIKIDAKDLKQGKENELLAHTKILEQRASQTRALCVEVVDKCKEAVSSIYTAVSIALSVLMNKFSVSIPNQKFDFSSFETCNELVSMLDGRKILETFSFKPVQYFSLVPFQKTFSARLNKQITLDSTGEVVEAGTDVDVVDVGYSKSWLIDVHGEEQVVDYDLLEVYSHT